MKEKKKGINNKSFLICEAVLLVVAAFFKFALLGYTATSIVLIAVAFLLFLNYLISIYRRGNEKNGKRLKIIFTAMICVGIVGFIVIEIPIISNARTDKDPKTDYVIVLGAGVNGTVPSLSLVDRLVATKNYMNAYPDSIAVLTGGMGEGEEISEGACMKDWLINAGISEDRIITEEKATSTIENIEYSLDKIEENGGNRDGKVAILSAEYHLYRAKYYARELGCEPVGVAARTSYVSLKVNYFIREAVAILYSRVI